MTMINDVKEKAHKLALKLSGATPRIGESEAGEKQAKTRTLKASKWYGYYYYSSLRAAEYRLKHPEEFPNESEGNSDEIREGESNDNDIIGNNNESVSNDHECIMDQISSTPKAKKVTQFIIHWNDAFITFLVFFLHSFTMRIKSTQLVV